MTKKHHAKEKKCNLTFKTSSVHSQIEKLQKISVPDFPNVEIGTKTQFPLPN
jgi:hypothetical protein